MSKENGKQQMGCENQSLVVVEPMEVLAQEIAKNDAMDDVPSCSMTIDSKLPFPDMKPLIIKLCENLFNKWAHLDDRCFQVETVTGGLTNLLLKVSVNESKENVSVVTVRIFGPNTEYVIDRQRELQAICYLSAAGFGAKLCGIFGNGMVQSYIDARTLEPSDIRDPLIAAKIAIELREFHKVGIPGSREPQLWNDISNFLGRASALDFDDDERQRRYKAISFNEIRDEIICLKALTERLCAPVVFAHNDLLAANLMLSKDGEKLYLIDFEYGSYSYRGYDIGNHFNEYAGLDCDYTMYPDKNSQFNFFRHYLQPNNPHEVSDNDLEALYVETNCYALAAHLYWAIWALIQADASSINFDYLGYFFRRFSEYRRRKEETFSLAEAYLSAN